MVSIHRTAVAIRHIEFEDLGLLAPVLAAANWKVSYREAPTDDLNDPSIAGADLLIVLGGPIGVYETAAYPFLLTEAALWTNAWHWDARHSVSALAHSSWRWFSAAASSPGP